MKATKLVLTMSVLLVLSSACDLVLPPVRVPQGPMSEEGLDFGDAPDPFFPSLLASNGARTQDISQFWLGDTQEPSATTETDSHQVDEDFLDDGLESIDGQVLRFRLVKGASASVEVVYFNLLADANRDGEWSGEDEWVVVNEEVELAPGESKVLEVRILHPVQDVWMRAALTDTPVPEAQFPDGWDGTGLFKRGEIEDYLVTGPAVPSWNFKCDPNPLVLEHGETKAIALVIESDDPLLAWPNDGHIAGVSGDPDPAGNNWDPDADEVTGKIVWDANGNPSVEVGSIEDPPTRTVYYTFRPVLTQRAADGTIVQEHQRECQVVVKHTEPEPTPTPTPSKFILADISVTHTIREGYVHFTVHVRNQAYDGQIYGKEIFFDGVLVERFMYDFWILPHCQPSEVDIDYQGNPPKVIEFHFLRRDGSNLGSVFSQQVTTGMGKSVPGAGIPSPRPICV